MDVGVSLLAAQGAECIDVVLRFTAAFDAGRWDDMLEHFAEQGEWHRPDGLLRGRQALRDWIALRPPGIVVRHVLTNCRVTFEAPDQATVCSYVTVYRADVDGQPTLPLPMHGPQLLGEYTDRLTRTRQTGWLLTHRSVRVDFRR